MFKKAEIIVEIIKLIKSKQFPFTFDQIYEELISYFSGVPKDVYYSARLYKVGQKVFHPSAEVNQWFTVLSIEDEKILVVRLESGDIKKFPQLSNKPKIYIDGVPKDLADIKPMISNVLGLFKHLKNYFGYYISLEEDEYLPLEKVSTSEALKRYFEHLEESSLLSGETISDFESVCNHLGLTSLYYVAPKDNIESILTYGVMARNLAPASHTSFANEDIQDDRHLKIPNPAIPFTLHDYVPLFFCARPPLLYRFQNKPSEVLKMKIDPSILLKPNALFFNMNAVSSYAKCYSDFRDLPSLNWEKIRKHIWYAPGPDLKPYRQAEADVPFKLPIEYFQQIVVCTNETYDYVSELIEEFDLELSVDLDVSFF